MTVLYAHYWRWEGKKKHHKGAEKVALGSASLPSLKAKKRNHQNEDLQTVTTVASVFECSTVSDLVCVFAVLLSVVFLRPVCTCVHCSALCCFVCYCYVFRSAPGCWCYPCRVSSTPIPDKLEEGLCFLLAVTAPLYPQQPYHRPSSPPRWGQVGKVTANEERAIHLNSLPRKRKIHRQGSKEFFLPLCTEEDILSPAKRGLRKHLVIISNC